jgi:hypothetical protein
MDQPLGSLNSLSELSTAPKPNTSHIGFFPFFSFDNFAVQRRRGDNGIEV